MRAKAHNRNHRAEDGRAESTYPEVAALLAQADLPAAGHLQELAASADRDLAKAARRALYTLRQAGIEPPDGAAPPPGPALLDADTQPAGARRAVMTTADHRADIVLTFVYEEPHGGRPTAATFVGGDT